jgi:hypothetical protein
MSTTTTNKTKGGKGKYILQQKQPLPIYQDDFTPSNGNALQACIASIFGQSSIHTVPNFITLKCGYEKGIQDYLQDTNYSLRKEPFDLLIQNKNCKLNHDNGKICIVRGKSPRGEFGHVVVARIRNDGGVDMIHDPHPDGTFLDEKESFGWYMVFDPKLEGGGLEDAV